MYMFLQLSLKIGYLIDSLRQNLGPLKILSTTSPFSSDCLMRVTSSSALQNIIQRASTSTAFPKKLCFAV